jgi:hypothetical protein
MGDCRTPLGQCSAAQESAALVEHRDVSIAGSALRAKSAWGCALGYHVEQTLPIPSSSMNKRTTMKTPRSLLCLLLLPVAPAAAHWVDDPRYPDWAQRGRIVYLDGTEASDKDLGAVERLKAHGATPLIHAFTPHWPNDLDVVERLRRSGIPVDVRVEASLFFEDDHIDRFAFIHGKFLPGGWWFNHAWRTNYDWWRVFPESVRATTRKRNGDERLGYAGHHVTSRREGSPLAPEHRNTRAKQIQWLLTGADPLPHVPLRPYENNYAKDPRVPYPMLGAYAGLWYDNPSSGTSYDPSCREAWERQFREKFGEEIRDPPTHANPAVRRQWAKFWGDAWAEYYLWRKQLQDRILRERGGPFCHTAGNFSFISQPHGTAEFYLAKRGAVDMPGPSEYVHDYCRGRFHFLIKTMLAATHGRPAGKFYPNDLQIAESLAVCGTNTYRPAQAEFLAANVDLFGLAQPGARIAVLFHVEHNLIESHLLDLQHLVDQIASLGFPYEVVIEDDLDRSRELAQATPLVVLCQTDLSPAQVEKLRSCVDAGARVLLLGDCLVAEDVSRPQLPRQWRAQRTVADVLAEAKPDRVLADPRPLVPIDDLRGAIERLGGAGSCLSPGDPDVLLNVLRQPKGEFLLLGLVNYSGKDKRGLKIRLPDAGTGQSAGWISRDGGAGMLGLEGGAVTVPELRYGCTVLVAKDRAAVERVVQRNAARFPITPLAADVKRFAALDYGAWHGRRVLPENLSKDQVLCPHRVGATDRGGYLMADVVGPREVAVGSRARFEVRVLDTRYDYVEYWQIILEDTTTGERVTVPLPLPGDNPHGEAAKLLGATLSTVWTPQKAGQYQAFLAYRVTRVTHDGEPFLGPESVPAGYSGTTPANLFLKGQPLEKRPYEDRLRGLRVLVR